MSHYGIRIILDTFFWIILVLLIHFLPFVQNKSFIKCLWFSNLFLVLENTYLAQLVGSEFYNFWTMCGKSEGVSWWMESLGKSQSQNSRGCRPRGFWLWDFPRDFIHHDTPRLFHTFSFFCHPWLVKRDLFQPMHSLGSIMVIIPAMDVQYW